MIHGIERDHDVQPFMVFLTDAALTTFSLVVSPDPVTTFVSFSHRLEEEPQMKHWLRISNTDDSWHLVSLAGRSLFYVFVFLSKAVNIMKGFLIHGRFF
jgi:hypothetical protein